MKMNTRESNRALSAGGTSSSASLAYTVGQDVLARWNDGLFYLGNILKVDDINERCYIRFEDDSEHWAMFKDISKAANQGDIHCCLCRSDRSEAPNEIVLCDNCGLGYHQCCHNPQIGADVLKPDVEWFCRLCVFATTVKRGGALKKGPNAKALQIMKQSLPYDLNLLTWDAHHKTNVEHCYCYCGGPGEWYMKMLQCCRCRQWFHEACMQCLEFPLVYGDRWYIYVCSICNFGVEYLKRLEIKWVDVAQLTLFNLTVMHNKKYYDLSESIVPWIRENWESLQLTKLEDPCRSDIYDKLTEVLKSHRGRFQSGREIKKKGTLWGLRVRLPPPPPTVILPVSGQINDEVMSSVQMKGNKTKTFVPHQSRSPIPLKYRKRKEATSAVVSRNAKAKKLIDVASAKGRGRGRLYSANQEYKGYGNNAKSPSKQRKCSLDSIIPRLHSYSGHNHPFKTVLEQNEELERERLKSQLFQSYQNGYDTDTTSQSSQPDDTDKEQSDPSHSMTNGGSRFRLKHRRKMSRRKPEEFDSSLEDVKGDDITENSSVPPVKSEIATCAVTRSFKGHNVVDSAAINAVKSKEVSVEQLKSSVSHYFGASERLAQGEKFRVLARRVTPEKKVQYLVEWEGILA